MARSNVLDYITIASAGNATDFGDMATAMSAGYGESSEARGVRHNGTTDGSTPSNVIEYITIASTGNAADFGDATVARFTGGNAASGDGLRGVAMGGQTDGSTNSEVMDYVTIASTGNATDFGNLTVARRLAAGFSG
jgi:hypothetical protein